MGRTVKFRGREFKKVIDPKPAVRFCWVCSRKLRWARRNDGTAGFSFVEFPGHDGNVHPIHDACLGRALAGTPDA